MTGIRKAIRSYKFLVLGLLVTLGLLVMPTIAAAQSVPGFTVTVFATGIPGARGVTADPAGNIYTVGMNDGVVYKISPGGLVSVLADLPDGSWVGPYYDPVSGDLFVGSWQHGSITRIDLNGSGGSNLSWATGFAGVGGLTGDAAGNIYVSENFNASRVSKITPAGNVSPYSESGLNFPDGIGFGPSGELYVGNRNNGQVTVVPPGGGPATIFASGFDQPFDVLSDGAGNVYTVHPRLGTISKISPNGTVVEFGSGFGNPNGLAFDASGNLFVAVPGGDVIYKVAGVG